MSTNRNESARGSTAQAEAKDARLEAIERAKKKPAAPAAAEACGTCPWRRDNTLGESDPWLSDGHLMGYWDQIRTGSVMACHKTCIIPEVVTEEAAEHGWAPTPPHARKRECAGALAQVLKEEQLLEELGSYDEYFAKRGPFGMTRPGFAALGRRRRGDVKPAPRALAALEQYERPWFPAPAGDQTLPVVPPCACPVCTRHEEAHAAVTLTHPTTDEPITVDAGLATLIESLWRAGAVTVASCENLTDALEQLWPEQLPELRSRDLPAELNYQHTVRQGLAFVRRCRLSRLVGVR